MSQRTTSADVLAAVNQMAQDFAAYKAKTETQHADKIRRLEIIEKQVKYTNGRVTKLEEKVATEDAIEKYKRWAVGTGIGVVMCIAAVIGALWWIKG